MHNNFFSPLLLDGKSASTSCTAQSSGCPATTRCPSLRVRHPSPALGPYIYIYSVCGVEIARPRPGPLWRKRSEWEVIRRSKFPGSQGRALPGTGLFSSPRPLFNCSSFSFSLAPPLTPLLLGVFLITRSTTADPEDWWWRHLEKKGWVSWWM